MYSDFIQFFNAFISNFSRAFLLIFYIANKIRQILRSFLEREKETMKEFFNPFNLKQ